MRRYLIPALLALPLMTACFSTVDDNAAAIDPTTATTLHVTTRAATGEIVYPVLVMAYDSNGQLQGQQTLQDASADIHLQLTEGVYHITALSGQGGYIEPKDYDKKSNALTIPATGYATSPLMMGGADVMLGTGNASVSLTLSYRVASLALSLAEVPADVTAVSVGVSQQYGAIDMGGALSGQATATVPCAKHEGLWQSPTFYVLPGAGSTTTLTISFTSPSGQVSYGYELGEALLAAVPYRIQGTYVESTAPYITGVLTMEGWQDERSLSFDFGSGVSQPGGGMVVNVPTVTVSALPEACSIWQGHVVALTDNVTSTSADLLLLSLSEFTGIHSPKAEGYANEMSNVAAAYAEDEMRDWSVPTVAQARDLRAAYAGDYEELNAVLSTQGADAIDVYTSGNNNARFLCEQGNKTFNWAKSGSITTAGTSVKYRLRLVKVVHVEVK